MKPLQLFTLLAVLLMTSCVKGENLDEYQEFTGEYIGTFYSISARNLSADEYMNLHNNPKNWPNSRATVNVSISDEKITLLIDSGLKITRITSKFKILNGVLRCEDFSGGNNIYDYIEIKNGAISYYQHSVTSENSSVKDNTIVRTYGFSGECLTAYKID